ncbi:hypothetical protein OIU79_014161 [Salix purpurea]|uniref:Uncharacterized protein n=1 Tax=Salix purpurea TaxID=77065 RepID=A0A9Q0PQG6_SALPP|nr:hypothetical protein OIU79_014161 [Salix purpurea]
MLGQIWFMITQNGTKVPYSWPRLVRD